MLRLYNTLTKRKEEFIPLGKVVKMYNCGPTVYDYAHIGNFRAYIFADLLRRYLEYKKFKVKQVMNITDVGHMTLDDEGEDKVESSAKKQHKTPKEIANFYENAFFEDIEKLRIRKANEYPKATDNVKEMIDMIQILIDKGYAYAKNGSVYYDISKFPDYGKLSGNSIEELMAGASKKPNPEKNNPLDFALWKRDENHLMKWESPWGLGRPGWHIECSVMAMKYLGESIDIHTGGVDNIFPHHESEIAQSEPVTNKQFVKYWLHTTHLLVNGKKMSKSLGNFYTLRDLLGKGHDPIAIRYLLLSAHYKTQLNFTFKELKSAKTTVNNINDFLLRVQEGMAKNSKEENMEISLLVDETKQRFEDSMDDDLNVPLALSHVFDLIKMTNKEMDAGRADSKSLEKVYDFFLRINGIFDIIKEKEELTTTEKKLIAEREQLRKEKKFKEADEIRKKLEEAGLFLEDTPDGARWRRK